MMAGVVESEMGAVAWGQWPSPRFPSLLIGRVGDWRAGLGRSLCSLLPRPFGCEVSQYRDHATFPVPATSNAMGGFPALRSPVCFASRVMRPILLVRLSVESVRMHSASAYSTASSRSPLDSEAQNARTFQPSP